MNTHSEAIFETLKDKNLVLFFTVGVSLKTWYDIGMIDREVALYNELSKHFKHIYFFTYGDKEDLKYKIYLNDNVTVVPKKYISNNILYSCLIPFIHHKILNDADILKTNQMIGSWSAVLSKLTYGKKLIVRTGYMASINLVKKINPLKKRVYKNIEYVAYKFADGIITSSPTNVDYVNQNYKPSGIHILIPNFIETDIFKPLKGIKKKNSICFIGRLNEEKNLFSLLEALSGLPYELSIIGSGSILNDLKIFAQNMVVTVNFFGNIPNHELPTILNQHNIFILPSVYENMPKTLLEAMACGMPVIGTDVKGINEVIEDGKNGILCNKDSDSIRKAILTLMEDENRKEMLGKNARMTIVENYSLDKLIDKELKLMAELI